MSLSQCYKEKMDERGRQSEIPAMHVMQAILQACSRALAWEFPFYGYPMGMGIAIWEWKEWE